MWDLDVDYIHDLERLRVDHHDLLLDEHIFIPAPLRIDRDDFLRERMEPDVARHTGARPDLEVDVRERLDVLLADDVGDPGTLLDRNPRATRAGLPGGAGAAAIPLAFGVHGAAAILLAFGVHVAAAVLLAFGVHGAAAVLLTFRLHVL